MNPLSHLEVSTFLVKTLNTALGYSDEEALQILDLEIQYLESLPKKIKLYRIVFADRKNQLNLSAPGTHWSDDREDLMASNSFASGYGYQKFIISVEADKSLVDLEKTLHSRQI